MLTQEQALRRRPLSKTLVFPLLDRWEELIESYTLDANNPPADYVFPLERRLECRLRPYMRTEYANGEQTINGFTSPTYRYGPAVYIRLRPEIATAAFNSTIGMDDWLSFHLIQWNADEALIIMEHSKIIGSRWLAIINPATIPADVRGE